MAILSRRAAVHGFMKQVQWALEVLSLGSALRYVGWKIRAKLAQRLPFLGFASPARVVTLRLRRERGGQELSFPLTTVSLYTLYQVWISQMYAVRPETPVHTIVDLGANLGFTSRWLLGEFPESRLVAVEPETSNAAVLRDNLKQVASATVIEACVAPKDGEVYLHLDSRADCHKVVGGPSDRSVPVPAVSMPSLMQRCGIEQIDLLKMDIEGAEAALLGDDCEQWIGRVGCMVIEIHDELPIDELERRMARHGFEVERSPDFAVDRIAVCVNHRAQGVGLRGPMAHAAH